MPLEKVDDKMIRSYMEPGLEVLKAMLKGFNLHKSLSALTMLQSVLVAELKEQYRPKKKK